MRIGNVTLDGVAVMAPMAGVADYAVRTLARRHGACLATGEMTSAKGLSMGSEKSRELLAIPDAHPYAVQIFGAQCEPIRAAAAAAHELGADIIDINMGCPAPKIVSGGAGSALLRNLPLAADIVRAAIDGADGTPVTVKLRRGYEAGDDVAAEAAALLERAGAAAICIHGRTRAQMYSPPVDIDCIRRVKQAVGIPVIGNGDICTAADALHMLEYTGCDMVMVGRGALGNPWLFGQINAAVRGESIPPAPPLCERLDTMREEIRLLLADKGEYTGYREARKHVAWYLTGLRGAAALRRRCGTIAAWEDIEEICREAAAQNPPEEQSGR